jgi:curli production assembly/transport component CsgG
MFHKSIIALSVTLMLGGCATTQNFSEPVAPEVSRNTLQSEFDNIPGPLTGKPIVTAVYSFTDKTGQRKPISNIASLSTATTQGAEAFLIKALQDVGRGRWFKVVERVGIDNLTKERLIIRQMREAYEGPNAQALPPMTFAGIILEGGIVGYDSSTKSGGAAARWLGIGSQTQYSEDTVTVALRAISVANGEVIAAVTVQKTIVSSADSISALKFFSDGTKAFEAEAGLTINEPITLATKAAVEFAVLEMIKEGQRKGLWSYAQARGASYPVAPQAQPAPVKKETTSDVPAPAPEARVEATPSASTTSTGKKSTVVVNSWVRKGQDILSPPVRNVNVGQTLYVLQSQNDWSEVEFEDRFGRHKGWIKSSSIKIDEAENAQGR